LLWFLATCKNKLTWAYIFIDFVIGLTLEFTYSLALRWHWQAGSMPEACRSLVAMTPAAQASGQQLR